MRTAWSHMKRVRSPIDHHEPRTLGDDDQNITLCVDVLLHSAAGIPTEQCRVEILATDPPERARAVLTVQINEITRIRRSLGPPCIGALTGGADQSTLWCLRSAALSCSSCAPAMARELSAYTAGAAPCPRSVVRFWSLFRWPCARPPRGGVCTAGGVVEPAEDYQRREALRESTLDCCLLARRGQAISSDDRMMWRALGAGAYPQRT